MKIGLNTQKTTNCTPLNFKVGDRVYFKNKQPGKWDLKWRAGNRIVCIEHNGNYLHIKTKLTGKTRSAMWRMLHMNCQSSCGMLTQHLAELENLKIIWQISTLLPWIQIKIILTMQKTMLLIKPPFFSLIFIGTLAERKQDTLHHEPVLFHSVLKAYPTCQSWIITAHISLGHLNRQLCMFNHQKTFTL